MRRKYRPMPQLVKAMGTVGKVLEYMESVEGAQ